MTTFLFTFGWSCKARKSQFIDQVGAVLGEVILFAFFVLAPPRTSTTPYSHHMDFSIDLGAFIQENRIFFKSFLWI